MESFKERLMAALRNVVDPELGINVVDLGLIYGVSQKESGVHIAMTATTPFCPYLPQLIEQVENAARSLDEVETAEVEIVWSPPWSPEKLSNEAKAQLGIL